MDVPTRLLRRLDALAGVLAARGDALALIGVGSVGADGHRLDEHSDLDFFAVVEDGAKPAYLRSIDWLEAVAPVAYSFENTVDGRKVLFEDGLYAEYAVFTPAELREAAFSAARLVWRRDDAPADLEGWGRAPEPAAATADWHANEALTNLFVGLHRDRRGERLSATRLVQVHAVDRVLAVCELLEPAATPRQDPFAAERGVERRFAPDVLPLAAMAPGYEANAAAALAILGWLEARVAVSAPLAAAIRELAV